MAWENTMKTHGKHPSFLAQGERGKTVGVKRIFRFIPFFWYQQPPEPTATADCHRQWLFPHHSFTYINKQ